MKNARKILMKLSPGRVQEDGVHQVHVGRRAVPVRLTRVKEKSELEKLISKITKPFSSNF